MFLVKTKLNVTRVCSVAYIVTRAIFGGRTVYRACRSVGYRIQVRTEPYRGVRKGINSFRTAVPFWGQTINP